MTETITVTDTYAGNSYEFADKDDIEKIRVALKETFEYDAEPISGDYAENSLKYPNYDWYDTNDGDVLLKKTNGKCSPTLNVNKAKPLVYDA